MADEQRKRVVIEQVLPEVDCGRFPAKRVIGEKVVVFADIFADGHDALSCRLLHRKAGNPDWQATPMRLNVNDQWQGEFEVRELGIYEFTVEGWVDHFKTWQHGLEKKYNAGQDVSVELIAGAELIRAAAGRSNGSDSDRLIRLADEMKSETQHDLAVRRALGQELVQLMEASPELELAVRYKRVLQVRAERPKALFSTWYERFPRSCSPEPGKHGTFRDMERLLPEIARMGFDVLYLPPIHPIGHTNRKGKNNATKAAPEDPGSPWGIGSEEGGHMSVHPDLGTIDDLEHLIQRAAEFGMELALDIAYQCSPDHPYVKEHPEWFRHRPDGSIQYAENPPKKYEDIYPIHFECEDWHSLWEELKNVVLFWAEKGVRIFRVDNPHTKPFRFWEWMIGEVKRDYPDTIFLAEAFTRPKVMRRLAKLGYTQSYTYFTWRNSKYEITEYLKELTQTESRDFFWPNFWPNTPDILPEFLQYGGRPAFIIKLVLAATLSSNYGIYGPAFELIENVAAPGREEYIDSEKYEIKAWDWDRKGNLKDFIARLNRVRRENSAFQTTWNLKFYEVDNDYLLFFGKRSEDGSEVIFTIVNLDPFHTQSGWLHMPLKELGIDKNQPYLCHDLLSEDKYIWQGERNYVQLNPQVLPAHIFKLKARMRREMDFDYFM